MCRAWRRIAACVLLALAAGCTPFTGTRRDPAVIPPPLGSVRPPATAEYGPSGAILPAGGSQPADPPGVSKFDQTGQPVGQPLGPPRAADPHLRSDPTLYGGRLGLNPNEMPIEKVIDLSRQLEAAAAQNRVLLGRVRELEALGHTREQALQEAVRDVEAALAEVDRARGTLATQRAEIVTLQKKIQQMEQEDIETLKLMIAALEKLLPPPRKEPLP